MRRKMNLIIRWLETDGFDAHRDVILSPEYSRAVRTLIDTGCVKPFRAYGGDILNLILLDRYATYKLERYDLWINRIISFLSGVAVTVVATVLLHVLL